jgi:putative SOS response-associated peptidase YedK
MCSNYTPPKSEVVRRHFGVQNVPEDYKAETYPGYLAPIVRIADDGSGQLECVNACFGMVPHWAELTLARHTYNARSETVASKPSFRHAFAKRQWCIIPAESFFEPSYESGRAVRWKIARDDGALLGIAGLWEWRPTGGPDDLPLLSFTMLTINADNHPLMRRFHRPEDEKRMPVLLDPPQYAAWLQSTGEQVPDFWRAYPAQHLISEAAPRMSSRTLAPTPKLARQPAHSPSLWEEE